MIGLNLILIFNIVIRPYFAKNIALEKIIDVISLLGAFQGILLTILLLSRKNNHLANRLLAAFVLLVVLDCIEPITARHAGHPIVSAWILVWGGLTFLHGPLLYLYTTKLTNPDPSVKWTDSRHAIPCVSYLALITVASFFQLSAATEIIASVILHEIFFIVLLSYSLASLYQLKIFESLSSNDRPDIKMINLQWLKTLIRTTLLLYITSFIIAQLSIFGSPTNLNLPNLIIQFLIIVVVYSISYKSISQPEIFSETSPESGLDSLDSKEKYKTSRLSQENSLRIKNEIQVFLETKKPYLDPTLSLEKLSDLLNISKYHISQVINTAFKMNFYDLINTYRIQEFQRLLNEPDNHHLTIMGIAQKSGFNSKTTFNLLFKKFVGQTPSAYLRERKKSMTEIR